MALVKVLFLFALIETISRIEAGGRTSQEPVHLGTNIYIPDSNGQMRALGTNELHLAAEAKIGLPGVRSLHDMPTLKPGEGMDIPFKAGSFGGVGSGNRVLGVGSGNSGVSFVGGSGLGSGNSGVSFVGSSGLGIGNSGVSFVGGSGLGSSNSGVSFVGSSGLGSGNSGFSFGGSSSFANSGPTVVHIPSSAVQVVEAPSVISTGSVVSLQGATPLNTVTTNSALPVIQQFSGVQGLNQQSSSGVFQYGPQYSFQIPDSTPVVSISSAPSTVEISGVSVSGSSPSFSFGEVSGLSGDFSSKGSVTSVSSSSSDDFGKGPFGPGSFGPGPVGAGGPSPFDGPGAFDGPGPAGPGPFDGPGPFPGGPGFEGPVAPSVSLNGGGWADGPAPGPGAGWGAGWGMGPEGGFDQGAWGQGGGWDGQDWNAAGWGQGQGQGWGQGQGQDWGQGGWGQGGPGPIAPDVPGWGQAGWGQGGPGPVAPGAGPNQAGFNQQFGNNNFAATGPLPSIENINSPENFQSRFLPNGGAGAVLPNAGGPVVPDAVDSIKPILPGGIGGSKKA